MLCRVLVGLILCILQAVAVADVHLVVDVSGNIQRLDPQKERVAALKSFIQSLPDGSRAGIWIYAKQVNKLVSPGIVNDEWRRNALQSVSRIGGYGAYSNVSEALAQATYYWRHDNRSNAHHVILITDSGVRPTDSSEQNHSARQALLENLLPSLRRHNIKVDVLAFGKADHDLYQTIAADTDASYQSLAEPRDLSPALKKIKVEGGRPQAPAKKQKPIEVQEPILENPEPESVAQSTENQEAAHTQTSETVIADVPSDWEEVSLPAPEVMIAENNADASAHAEDIVVATETIPPIHHDHPKPPEHLVIEETVIVEEPVAETNVAASSTTAVPPSVDTSADALGAEEAEEIRAALATAEAELNELLNEFAAIPKDDHFAAAQGLQGQPTEQQPLVITLADGSVLITPDQEKVEEFTVNSHETSVTPSFATEQNSPPIGEASVSSDTSPHVLEATTAHPAAEVPAKSTEWPSIKHDPDPWPLILTILVVVNLGVILLLFVGRFFWMRHKRKKWQ